MKPYQKAEQLMKQHRSKIDFMFPESDALSKYIASVECAIISTDNLLSTTRQFADRQHEYWTEVKNALTEML